VAERSRLSDSSMRRWGSSVDGKFGSWAANKDAATLVTVRKLMEIPRSVIDPVSFNLAAAMGSKGTDIPRMGRRSNYIKQIRWDGPRSRIVSSRTCDVLSSDKSETLQAGDYHT